MSSGCCWYESGFDEWIRYFMETKNHSSAIATTERPMRVCFVSQLAWGVFAPDSNARFGGAESQMHGLAVALAKDPAFEVSFVLQDFGQPRELVIDGVRVIRYSRPFKGSRALKYLRWLSVGVSSFTRVWSANADVYVESPAGFPTFHCVAVARLRRRAALFAIASDGDLQRKPPDVVAAHESTLERRAFLWAMPRATTITALSENQRAELEREFDRDSVIIPNAFPIPEAPPAVDKDTVLWVASSQELKQPWLYLDLAEAYPTERFVMVMPSNDVALFERIQKRAQTLSNLVFVESVPFTEIQSFFDRAKVFVNTSTVEGFPNTFVQSAIAATPVLSLQVNPDKILDRGGFGRCAEGDFKRLGSDLEELLADDALRARMGAAGYAYARERHDIDVVIAQFKKVLQRTARPVRS